LLAAVLVMALAPRLTERPLAGTPVAVVVAPTPAIGQCVVGPERLRTAASPGLPLDDGTLAAGTQLRIGACTADHVGEIVGVDTAEPAPQAVSIYGFPFSFQVSGCAQAAFRYLGIDPGTEGPVGSVGDGAVNWAVTTRAQVVVATPSAEQAAVGQRWVACVLSTPETASTGTARDAYAGRGTSSAFGVCGGRNLAVADGQMAGLAGTASDCTRTHQAEQFGVAWFGGALPGVASLTSSCGALAASVTGIPDVTAGGRITVRPVVLAPRWAPKGWRQVACTVVVSGNSSLTGSLVGLGHRPLPWQ
jgi:hypothetical protein